MDKIAIRQIRDVALYEHLLQLRQDLEWGSHWRYRDMRITLLQFQIYRLKYDLGIGEPA